jgi:hypothetical protein
MGHSNISRPTRGRLARGLGATAAALLAAMLGAGCGSSDENATTYDVVVSVTSDTDLKSLHFTLQVLINDGDWIGEGAELDCTPLVDASLESDKFGDGTLDLALQSNVLSFPAPGDVIRCALKTSEIMNLSKLEVVFLDATDIAFSPTNADLEITSLEERI